MNAYKFHAIDDKGSPTGYTGLAAANDDVDLFWIIDAFIDPFSVVVYKPLEPTVIGFKIPDEDNVELEDNSEFETYGFDPSTDYIEIPAQAFEFNDLKKLIPLRKRSTAK